MRIKCPNCGSAAQIILTWEEDSKYRTEQVREYECKCGCVFEVTFIASSSVKIL